jgi:hypothetical protein
VFGPTGHGGFGLTVAPDLRTPFLMREQGADLMAGPSAGSGEPT